MSFILHKANYCSSIQKRSQRYQINKINPQFLYILLQYKTSDPTLKNIYDSGKHCSNKKDVEEAIKAVARKS